MLFRVTKKHIQQGHSGGFRACGAPGCMIQEAIRDATGWRHITVGYATVTFLSPTCYTYTVADLNFPKKSVFRYLPGVQGSVLIEFRLPSEVSSLIEMHDVQFPYNRTIKPFEFELDCDDFIASLREQYPEEFINAKDLNKVAEHG